MAAKPPDPAVTPPPLRRVFGVISPDQERTIRFLLGIGVMVRELVFQTGDPRMIVLVAAATLSGTSLTDIADDVRRTMRKKDGT